MREQLRAIRSEMARMADRQDTMGSERLTVRQPPGGLVGADTLHAVEIAST